MKKRMISFLLALTICAGLCLPVSAAGAGAGEKPMTIGTVEELLAFAEKVRKGEDPDAVLTADLDLEGMKWKPIGVQDGDRVTGYGYSGTFDGQGHTIRNIGCARYLGPFNEAGLFFTLGPEGVVQNLNLDVQFKMPYSEGYSCHIGGVAVYSYGKILNCNVSGKMDLYDGFYVGGVVGELLSGTVVNCSSSVEITNRVDKDAKLYGHFEIGGVIGKGSSSRNDTTVIDGCRYSGSLTVSGGAPSCGSHVGGIGGWLGGCTEIKNCQNTGRIEVTNQKGSSPGDTISVGGISGDPCTGIFIHSDFLNNWNDSDITIKLTGLELEFDPLSGHNCWNSGTASVTVDGKPWESDSFTPKTSTRYYLDGTSVTGGIGEKVSKTEAENGTLVELLNSYVRACPGKGLLAWKQGEHGPELSDTTQTPDPSANPARLSGSTALPVTGTAYNNPQTIKLNGEPVTFRLYMLKDEKGNASNYVELRDLAYALKDTYAGFDVRGYEIRQDEHTTVTYGDVEIGRYVMGYNAYTPVGTEMKSHFSGDQTYIRMDDRISINGKEVNLPAFQLTDSKGTVYTYIHLRELCKALEIKIG